MRIVQTFAWLVILMIAFNTCIHQTIHAQAHEGDSLVLVTLYNSLDGPYWTDNSGWLEAPMETWKGITMSGNRVVEVNLEYINLAGELPDEIGQLSQLLVLSIYLNNISGAIPESIGNLSQLEELIISRNAFTGSVPASIGQLLNLRELVLLDNQLVGPLPDLSSLEVLEEFVVGNNDFSGPFPAWILELDNVRFLGMRRAGLTGEVPENILEELPLLHHLRLDNNELEGDIGKWIKGTTSLNELEIFDNNFTGKLPDGVLTPEVRVLSIGRNFIEGIPDYSSVMEMKSYFGIDQNKLGFHELEKVLAVQTYDTTRLILGPQKPLLEPDTLRIMTGEPVVIRSGSESDNDSYQWYRNGEIIPGATSRQFEITAYTSDDAGVYHAVISNDQFNFDLERSPVTIETDGVSAIAEGSMEKISIYPNPAIDLIKVNGEDISNIGFLDLNGNIIQKTIHPEFDISRLSQGIYLLSIETGHKITVRKFMKVQ